MRCPCCDLPFLSEGMDGEVLEVCGTCGGQWLSREVLHRILSEHADAARARGESYSRPSPLTDPVHYRKCPACGELMLRKNFCDSSGIVVDVCSAHGVWFDAGELPAVVDFAETGAMAKAERDRAERARRRKQLDDWEQQLRAAGPAHYLDGRGLKSIDALADLARIVPGMDPEDD